MILTDLAREAVHGQAETARRLIVGKQPVAIFLKRGMPHTAATDPSLEQHGFRSSSSLRYGLNGWDLFERTLPMTKACSQCRFRRVLKARTSIASWAGPKSLNNRSVQT